MPLVTDPPEFEQSTFNRRLISLSIVSAYRSCLTPLSPIMSQSNTCYLQTKTRYFQTKAEKYNSFFSSIQRLLFLWSLAMDYLLPRPQVFSFLPQLQLVSLLRLWLDVFLWMQLSLQLCGIVSSNVTIGALSKPVVPRSGWQVELFVIPVRARYRKRTRNTSLVFNLEMSNQVAFKLAF